MDIPHELIQTLVEHAPTVLALLWIFWRQSRIFDKVVDKCLEELGDDDEKSIKN